MICIALDTDHYVRPGSHVIIYREGEKDKPLIDCPYEELVLKDIPDGNKYRICVRYRDVFTENIEDAKCAIGNNDRAAWLSVDYDSKKRLPIKPLDERIKELKATLAKKKEKGLK